MTSLRFAELLVSHTASYRQLDDVVLALRAAHVDMGDTQYDVEETDFFYELACEIEQLSALRAQG